MDKHNAPVFSVIVPTYNAQPHIRKCLESIIRQQFSNYEVLVQDGLSTDGTLDIVRDIQAKNPRVRLSVHASKDRGIYDAMNKAARHASGIWLYFLGSDDALYDEQVLGSVYRFVTRNPKADMVYGNVVRIHSKEVHFGRFDLEKLLGYNICHQSIFMKRSAFDTYGPFDETYPACADWDLNLKLFKGRAKIRYMGLKVAHYNENGFSNTFRDNLFFEQLAKERKMYYSHWPNYFMSILKRIVRRAEKQLLPVFNKSY